MLSYTLIAVLAADLLATSGDITQTWTSAMFPKLKSNDTSINPIGRPITSEEDSLMGSLLNLGAMAGAIPYGLLADKIGRKLSLLSIAIPHIASYLIYAFSTDVNLFYFARFINGFSVGAGYTLLPLYIAEISEDSNRGCMSATLSMFWTFGNFLPVGIGPYLSIRTFNLILVCFPILFLVVFTIFGVETPYYYVKVDDTVKAEKSLMQLRSLDKKGVQIEIENIKGNFNEHWSDIFKDSTLRKSLLISVILIILQSFSGNIAISYYMQLIFEASGSKLPSDISSTICGAWTFVTSIVNIYSTDKIGRKLPLIVSCILMTLAHGMLGTFFYIKNNTDMNTEPVYWLPIFCVLFFIFAYNFGMTSMPWTISSELFPSNVKRISASTVSLMCWFSSFVLTKYFDDMTEFMGQAGTWWTFSCVCLFSGIFVFYFVPETKGKSFSEIQNML